ncbi:hypothetical protein Emag_005941 [Eimeria magna]
MHAASFHAVEPLRQGIHMLSQAATTAAAAAAFAAALSEAPMNSGFSLPADGGATRPLQDGAIAEETVAALDGERAHLLQRDASQISAKSEEPAGGELSEGKTSRANIGRELKEITGASRATHLAALAALIAAFGILLTAAGWQLTGALIGGKEMRELSACNFQQLEVELSSNIERLREAWQFAPEDVRLQFAGKLKRYERPTSDEAVVASYEQSFEGALSALLLPAAELGRAPSPVSGEGETTLRRQLLLSNGCMVAAQVQLTFLTQAKERRRQRASEPLPSREALMVQTTDLVSLESFLQMAVGETQIAEEGGLVDPRIPRVLARALADSAVESELARAAAAEAQKAFAQFRIDYEDLKQPLALAPDLIIPGGGRFPTARFLAVLKEIEERSELAPTPSEALMQVVEDFSVEKALDTLNQVVLEAAEQKVITRNTILSALTRTPAAEQDQLAAKSEGYYRALLWLLDFDQ